MTELGAAIATAVFLAIAEFLRVRADHRARATGQRRTRAGDANYPVDFTEEGHD